MRIATTSVASHAVGAALSGCKSPTGRAASCSDRGQLMCARGAPEQGHLMPNTVGQTGARSIIPSTRTNLSAASKGSFTSGVSCNASAQAQTAASEAYRPNPEYCLVLTVEIDIQETAALTQLPTTGAQGLEEAAEVICQKVGAVNRGDLKVETLVCMEASFDAVNSLPVSSSWWTTPVVVQCVFPSADQPLRLFVRVATNLEKYDGVTALHTAFNVVEYFEHHGSGEDPEQYLSLPAFKSANKAVDFDEKKMGAHLEQLERLEAAFDSSSGQDHSTVGLPAGPARIRYENDLKPRVWTRFSNCTTTFKEFVAIAAEVQERLGLSHIAYTVNYSPLGALGRLPTVWDTFNHEKRLDGIFTPIGPPLPMNIHHANATSYMLFWNNYGRMDPNISGRVKGLSWNWTGFMKTFVPFMFCATVQGKAFFLTSFSEPDQRACNDLLDKIEAEVNDLHECKQPLRSG